MACNLCFYIGLGLIVIIVVFIFKFLRPGTKKYRRKDKRGPKDTVILYQFTRGPWSPSISPWPIKVETYLRMANIPYQNDFSMMLSSKGKIPWISYNEDDVADSQFSVEYLNKKLDIDFSSHLTPEERAIARAFRKLVEGDLFWVLVAEIWLYDETNLAAKHFGVPRWLRFYVKRNVRKWVYTQGMGRHTHKEMIHIATQNVQAISDFMGNKQYLMGDRPCEEDCALFGMLAPVRWQLKTSDVHKYMNDKCPNLIAYVERMKEKFWPDWDECITHDGTKKALK